MAYRDLATNGAVDHFLKKMKCVFAEFCTQSGWGLLVTRGYFQVENHFRTSVYISYLESQG